MALLKIRYYGDPCLRKKSTPVKDIGPGERLLIQSMIDTMHQEKGVGLAAPQVGINQRIFVADIGEGPIVFINPMVLRRSGVEVLEEGCLSIPGITVAVKRGKKVLVRYKDSENNVREKVFEQLMARVIQHETDHLNGRLILDYVKMKDRPKVREELKKAQRI